MTKNKKNLIKSVSSSKKKFILIIGDDGAILSLVAGKVLEERLFVAIDSPSDIGKLKEILANNKDVPISILVDLIEQSYTHQSLPAVSSFSINRLVKKKLDRMFPENHLKGSILIDRNKIGRMDWNFLLVSVPFTEPLSTWFNIVIEQDNPLDGIYLFPIEAERIIGQFNKVFLPKPAIVKKDKSTPNANHWQLFITHNKVTGFRQVAFKNNKLSFTRQISVDNTETSNFIAGTIEQEAINIFEYLKRLSLQESDKIDIYVIVSKDIKKALQKINATLSKAVILTPQESAIGLGYEHVVGEDDKYGDILLSVLFANSKPVLSFIPESVKNLFILEKIRKLIFFPLYVIIPSCLLYLSTIEYQVYTTVERLRSLDDTKKNIIASYEKDKKIASSMGDVTKISEVISLYKILSNNEHYSPIQTIHDFINVGNGKVLVNNLNWQIISSDSRQNSTYNFATPEQNNQDNNKQIQMTLELELINNNSGYQGLFDDFDNFTKILNTAFSNYNIEYSKLTDNIDFKQANKIIPVKLKITGPKNKS
ncbi:hypothetical protein SZ25_00237 [Candidatus Arcanobacter lacustris]|uniref:Competence protein A n=1 Tax=Candidatus Arcanibacter lacustris TaxID=1607817 RepID=A0A0F5MPU4_9RICK|nr:hypothetical protein SZ25_00237 [Candidatus Arcanobacter lacustris]